VAAALEETEQAATGALDSVLAQARDLDRGQGLALGLAALEAAARGRGQALGGAEPGRSGTSCDPAEMDERVEGQQAC